MKRFVPSSKLSRRRIASRVAHMLRGLVRFVAWPVPRRSPQRAYRPPNPLEQLVGVMRREFPGLRFTVESDHYLAVEVLHIDWVGSQRFAISRIFDHRELLIDPDYTIAVVHNMARELSRAIGEALAKGAA